VSPGVGASTHKLRPVGPPLEGATRKFDLDNALVVQRFGLFAAGRRWVSPGVGESTHKLRPVGPPLEGATRKFDLDNALVVQRAGLFAAGRRWVAPSSDAEASLVGVSGRGRKHPQAPARWASA